MKTSRPYLVTTLLAILLSVGCAAVGGSTAGTAGPTGPGSPTVGAAPTATTAIAAPIGEGVVASYGQYGSDPGQFSSPRGLALDGEGNLYVADTGNRRVQVFDPQGVFLMSVADGRFEGPRYVTVDDLDRIYVSDAAEAVHVFDGRGEPLQSFGQPGSQPTQFSQIADLVVDSTGDLYVVDGGNARVQKFSLLRGLLFTLGDTGGETELPSRPQGITADALGNIYVADAGGGRILKYAPGGTFLSVLATDLGELRQIAVDQQGYLYAVDGTESVVVMIDAQGRTIGRLGEGQLSDPWGVAVDEGGRVYVSDAGHHRILVLEVPGEMPTAVPAASPVASPAVTLVPLEGTSPWPMYGGDPQHSGRSQAQGPVAPVLKWVYRAGLLAGSPVIAADGSLYFGSLDGNLYALEPGGVEKWRSPLGQISGAPALSPEGLIYAGVASPLEEMFYALNRDGSVAWSFHLEGYIVESAPVVGDDGTVHISASSPQTGGGAVVALSPDGSERWRYEVASRLPFAPALGPDGTVYVGARDGNLYALSPDGTLKWQASLGTISSSCAVGADGTIYVATGSTYQALSPSDGVQMWSFAPTKGGANSMPALGPAGEVYVTDSANELYAVNQDGTAAWTFAAEAEEDKEVQLSSPATVDAAGIVHVGTQGGELLAVKADGSLNWRFALPEGGMILVGPALGGDGTLYVGAGSNLYAVGR